MIGGVLSSLAKRRTTRGLPSAPAPFSRISMTTCFAGFAERVVDDRAGRRIRAERGVGGRRRVLVLAAAHADRGRGREEVRVGVRDARVDLAQRRHVVEHPDRAALRRGDEVVAVDEQVAHPRDRQVALQRLPRVAVVERDVDAGVGAGVEQAFLDGIGADDGDEMAVRQSIRDLRPGLAVVVRAHGDRVEIVLPVVVDGGVRGAGFERGEIERGDLRPLRDVVRRDVAPVRAAVGGGLDQAVVGADPDFVVACAAMARSSR